MIYVRFEQFLKVKNFNSVTCGGTVNEVIAVPLKAEFPIDVTESGILISFSLLQLLKA